MVYLSRAIDSVVGAYLASMGGVLIEGPRGCGKTSTGLEHSRSSIRLDRSPTYIQLAELNPSELLKGETPRLLDEWQLAPDLWNVVRHEIDDRQERGQFILSGSARPADDVTRHSGAGRIGRVRMRTMSLAESGVSSGEVSLSRLSGENSVSATSPLAYADMAEQAVRGGWPALLEANTQEAILFNRSYCDDLCRSEIPQATGVRHDVTRLRRLLGAMARSLSGEVTMKKLAQDMAGTSGEVPDTKTVTTYRDALGKVFAVDELSAWSVALRSRSRLRTSPKIHLADPALACAVLGVGVDRLARDPEYFGQVFESMVIRDLRALAGVEHGRVYHYRDNTGLEVDAIVEYPEGKWGVVEVKLGSSRVADAERSLLTLRDERVDLDRVGVPAFLAVITATEHAYTLPSGVHVIPLGVLGA